MASHRDVTLPAGGRYRLRRARVPGCFLKQPVAGAPDAEGSVLVDIIIDGETIGAIEAAGAGDGDIPAVDLEGRQVWATLVDMHAHLDKGQILQRTPAAGTLAGAAAATLEDRKRWTPDDIAQRMGFGLRCAYTHGVGAIRTHIDSHEGLAERSFYVFRALRDEWAGRVELQAVGLVPMTVFRGEYGARLADIVAESGAVLGGSTDAIYNYAGAGHAEIGTILDRFFTLAAERGLDVDLHVDQTADLTAFWLPHIAEAVLRHRFKGRVVCDHCVNLALQPDEVIRRTIALCRESGIAIVTMPTPMMYLMDREAGRTPRWRGVTLAQELDSAGIPTAIGGDNCRDAWFPFGDHDMVDTFQQAVRVFQLDDPLSRAVAMAGPNPAAIIGTDKAGAIAPGRPAGLILFAARSLNELMCRPQADRIVINRGRRVTDPLPEFAELDALS